MKKSICKKFEKNIYVEERCGAFRFIVAVHPLPKDSATFSSREDGIVWARRRRVELLEDKAKHAGIITPSTVLVDAVPQSAEQRSARQPDNISLAEVFDSFEETQLGKLAGAQAEASRLRRLRQWFGRFTLGQLDYRVLEKWQTQRFAGLLGSGRNPNRGDSSEQDGDARPLTKHQRHWRKLHEKEVPVKQVYPVSTQTVRHELVLLRRAVQNYFKLKGLMLSHGMWLQSHYLMQLDLPPAADPRDRRLSDEEVKAVLSRLDTVHLRSAVLCALLTTLRCSEIVSLRWEDVDFSRNIIRLKKPGHVKKTKTSTRDVPLLPGAVKVLQDLGPEKKGPLFPISASGLSQAWRRAADEAGIYDARLHDCRREAISRLIETCKLSLHTIVVFSGHSDLDTLQRHYVRLNPQLIASQLAEIPDAATMIPSL